jgi:Ser/Thr protein kinase RdoA (MazF antagonist)
MTSPSLHPYEQLTPDVVLDALAEVGLFGDGRLTALSSYENRVYQASLEDVDAAAAAGTGLAAGDKVVLKFYRPGRWSEAQILEEHAFAAELMAAEIPMVGPLQLQGRTLHQHAGFAFSVSPRRGGRRPELEDMSVLEWIGRLLGRIHRVGAVRPFAHRPALNPATFGHASRKCCWTASTCRWTWPRAGSGPLPRPCRWPAAFGTRCTAWAGCNSYACTPTATQATSLWTPEGSAGAGPHFVDLDDARSGPAVQDLWMLLSGERGQQLQQLGALVDGYEEFGELDRRELRLIEVLRTLRLVHYSAWLAQRWADPIFPINFPWFGSSDYWSGQVDMLVEQTEAMQAAALVA